MKRPLLFMLVVLLLVVGAEVHAQTELRPISAPCDNTCVSAPQTRTPTAGAFGSWWWETMGYPPPRITAYPFGPGTGPTIGPYIPPPYPQPKVGIGSGACQLAIELHRNAIAVGNFRWAATAARMVQTMCFPSEDERDFLENDELAWAAAEEDLFLGVWIDANWDSLFVY
jgi:hypothetical protein